MNRRSLFVATFAVAAAAGIVFLSIPFISSLSMTAKQENDTWGACDVSNLAPGAVKKCGWAMVYRRTPLDKSAIRQFEYLLADAHSNGSKQPESARNQWRSESQDFFVFKAWAPVRGCAVELKNPGVPLGSKSVEKAAILTLPYFTEPCEGRTWDTSGRLYRRSNYPMENYLIVPKVRWVSEFKVLIYGG